MACYEFVTIWRVDAPLEKVWNEIYYTEYWPDWWKGVQKVEELQKGDDLGIGSIRRYTWQTKLPYKLIFEIETIKVEPMTYLEGISEGELDGKGIWRLSEKDDQTICRYDWIVETTKPWMNILATGAS
ncbi:MAG: SRPBCC family protein, partial [Thermodesulfobacteriota bacterium]